MNLPNKLSVARIFLSIIFLAVFLVDFPYHYCIALVVFSIASLTDFWDGHLARKYKLETKFGILMDPLADKILVCSAFIAFVELRHIYAWMTIIIVSREFVITGLRLLASSSGQIIAADRAGKHKTTWQLIAVISSLVLLSHRELFFTLHSGDFLRSQEGIWRFPINFYLEKWAMKPVNEISLWVATFLTLISGIGYLYKNRHLFAYDT